MITPAALRQLFKNYNFAVIAIEKRTGETIMFMDITGTNNKIVVFYLLRHLAEKINNSIQKGFEKDEFSCNT